MVDLALADNATPSRDIASPIFATVAVDTPADECARLRRHYDLSQLPVVDGPVVDRHKLIGVILSDSLLGVRRLSTTRDRCNRWRVLRARRSVVR